jgi:hypothetical protein
MIRVMCVWALMMLELADLHMKSDDDVFWGKRTFHFDRLCSIP